MNAGATAPITGVSNIPNGPSPRPPQPAITPLRRIFANATAANSLVLTDAGESQQLSLGNGAQSCDDGRLARATALSDDDPSLVAASTSEPLHATHANTKVCAHEASQDAPVGTLASSTQCDSAQALAGEGYHAEARGQISRKSLSSSMSVSQNEGALHEEKETALKSSSKDTVEEENTRSNRSGGATRTDSAVEAEIALSRFLADGDEGANEERTTTFNATGSSAPNNQTDRDISLTRKQHTKYGQPHSMATTETSHHSVALQPRPSLPAPFPTAHSVTSSSLCISSSSQPPHQPPTRLVPTSTFESAILALSDVPALRSLLLRSVTRQQALEQVLQNFIEGRRALLVHSLKLRDERDELRRALEAMSTELTEANARAAAAELSADAQRRNEAVSDEILGSSIAVAPRTAELIDSKASGASPHASLSDLAGVIPPHASDRIEISVGESLTVRREDPLQSRLSKSPTRKKQGPKGAITESEHVSFYADPCGELASPRPTTTSRNLPRSPRHNKQSGRAVAGTATDGPTTGLHGESLQDGNPSPRVPENRPIRKEANARGGECLSQSDGEDTVASRELPPPTATIPTAAPRAGASLIENGVANNAVAHPSSSTKKPQLEARPASVRRSAVASDDVVAAIEDRSARGARGEGQREQMPNHKNVKQVKHNDQVVPPLKRVGANTTIGRQLQLSLPHTTKSASPRGATKQKVLGADSTLAFAVTQSNLKTLRDKSQNTAVKSVRQAESSESDEEKNLCEGRGASVRSCVPSSSASTTTASANVGARARKTPFVKPKKTPIVGASTVSPSTTSSAVVAAASTAGSNTVSNDALSARKHLLSPFRKSNASCVPSKTPAAKVATVTGGRLSNSRPEEGHIGSTEESVSPYDEGVGMVATISSIALESGVNGGRSSSKEHRATESVSLGMDDPADTSLATHRYQQPADVGTSPAADQAEDGATRRKSCREEEAYAELRRQSVALSPCRRTPAVAAAAASVSSLGVGGGSNSEGSLPVDKACNNSGSGQGTQTTSKGGSFPFQTSTHPNQRRASPLGAMRRVLASVGGGGGGGGGGGSSNVGGAAYSGGAHSVPSGGVGANPARRGPIHGRAASPSTVSTVTADPSTSAVVASASALQLHSPQTSSLPRSGAVQSQPVKQIPNTAQTGVTVSGTTQPQGSVPTTSVRPTIVTTLSREKMAILTSSVASGFGSTAAVTSRTNVSTPNLTSRARKRTPDRRGPAGAGAATAGSTRAQPHTNFPLPPPSGAASNAASGVVGSTPPIPSKLSGISAVGGGEVKGAKNASAAPLATSAVVQ